MAFTTINHSPGRSEIRKVLENLRPYEGMLLLNWLSRGYTPQEPNLLGWIQREIEAGGDHDFWGGSHRITDYRGYIDLDSAVELIIQLEPNYILYGDSS